MWLQAPGQDRDEGDLDESDEVLLCPLEDRVQPPVIRNPGEGALNDPADSGREELAITAASDGLDCNTELPACLGQTLAPVAEVAQRRSPEAFAGELAEHRDDTFRIMHVGWRDVDRQRDAVLVDAEVNLDAVDLLAAIEATAEAAQGRPAGSAVDDDSTRLGGVTAGQPPGAAQPVEQPAPQTKTGPAGKQGEQRAERDVAELSDAACHRSRDTRSP